MHLNFRDLINLFLVAVVTLVMGCASPEDKKQAFKEKGDTLFEQAAYDKARLEYQNAVQIDPQFTAAHFALAKTLFQLKNFKGAYNALQRTIELDSEHLEARAKLGRILLAGKAVEKASDQAEAILKSNPDHLNGNLLKASILFFQGEFIHGDGILERLFAAEPRNPDLFMMGVSSARRHRDNDREKTLLEKGTSLYPDHMGLILLTAQMHAGQKDWAGVARAFERAIVLNPKVLRYRLDLAKVSLAQDRVAQARDILDRALAELGGNDHDRLAIAKFWISAGKLDQARGLLEDGLAKTPDTPDFTLVLADIHGRLKQLDKAEAVLRRGLEQLADLDSPGGISMKTSLAKFLLAGSRRKEGRQLVEEVLAADPKNMDARYMKGTLLLMENDGPGAATEFRTVVQNYPDALKAQLSLARAHLMAKEPELALNVLDKACSHRSKKGTLLKAMAQIYMGQKRSDQAEALLIQAMEEDPAISGPHMDLGDFYLACKRHDEALNSYRRALDVAPDKVLPYIRQANVHGVLGQHDKALAILTQGHGALPHAPQIVLSLVKVHLALGQKDQAEHVCRNQVKAHPDQAFAHKLLGDVLISRKKFDSALNSLGKASDLAPEWGGPYDSMARIYLLRDDAETAIEKFETAVDKTPGNKTAWMVLAGIHTAKKDFVKAARVYEQAFKHNPDLWSAANNLACAIAETSKERDKLEIALAYARKALDLNPESGLVLDTLGWIQFLLGEADPAREILKKAMDRQPDNPVIHYHMAVVLDFLKEFKRARYHLEQALAADSNFSDADKALGLLKQYEASAG